MMTLLYKVLALCMLVRTNGIQTKAFGCTNHGNNDELRMTYLKFHNDERTRLASGVSPGKGSRPLNSAKNMYRMDWSCELEDLAQKHITSCNGDLATHRMYGRNQAQFSVTIPPGAHFDFKPVIEMALNAWWNEAKRQGVNKDNKFTNESIYYFANMAYSKATEIGCAHNTCGDKLQVFCLYNRIGVFMNRTIWRTGKACQTDEECTVFPNSTCESKLCVKPKEQLDDGKNAMCKKLTGMTDAIRKKFLDMHNHYRSLVALGRAVDKKAKGKKAPKAAKMQKLNYACWLESSAMQYAKQCTFEHSKTPGVGENLYMVASSGFKKAKLASMAVEDWFEELEEYGVGGNNRYSSAFSRPGAMLGHYTQLVWQNSKLVGCAIEDCAAKTMTIVVCHYSKPGNVIGDRIYAIGEPCSQCAAAEDCNKNLGLCFPKKRSGTL